MASTFRRRRVLQGIGLTAGSPALSGCVFGFRPDLPAGSLVISNDHSADHTVTLTVSKTSENSDDTKHRNEMPDPDTTPLWEDEEQFTVGSGDSTRREHYITEAGAFYFEARLETGEVDRGWIGFYETDSGIAEVVIFVSVGENGRVNLFGSHRD